MRKGCEATVVPQERRVVCSDRVGREARPRLGVRAALLWMLLRWL